MLILLEGFRDPADVLLTGQNIVAAISRPVAIGDLQIQVGASIGVALFPVDGETPMALLRSADQAIYDAKRAGRGRVRIVGSIEMAPLPRVS